MSDLTAALESVTVRYQTPHGTVTALHELSVSFPRGSTTAVLGRTGSGKSTLVSVLSLLRRPTSGRVMIGNAVASDLDGRRLADLRATAIGIAFQSFHLEPALTAAQNVMLPWSFRPRTPQRQARQRADNLLEQLGIGDLGDRLPHAMSGGQRQRVAIARALFTEPSLLLADEPTGNLDEQTAGDVAETLFSLPTRFGTTVVVVTHDAMVAAMADIRCDLVRGQLASAS